MFFDKQGCFENSDIMLRDHEKMINDEKKLVQLFNDHYINIVERSCVFKTEKVKLDIGSSNKNEVLSSILDKCRNHPSIIEIHKKQKFTIQFHFYTFFQLGF